MPEKIKAAGANQTALKTSNHSSNIHPPNDNLNGGNLNSSSNDKTTHKGNLTILKTRPNFMAAKTFMPDGNGGVTKLNYKAGTYFEYSEEYVTDIYELSNKLNILASDRYKLVIRDELAPHADPTKPVRRKWVENGGDFQPRKDGLQWVMLDIDDIACPSDLNLIKNPVECLTYVTSLLPEYFHGVTYHAHFSSSAGLDGGNTIRVHLWYWLDKPVTNAQLKKWAKQINSSHKLIDGAMFNTVQPHYTADPVFKGGVLDPFLNNRSMLIEGDKKSVNFPIIHEIVQYYAGSTSGLKPANSYENWMKLLGDHEGGYGFHEVLLHATWWYVMEHGADGTDVEALKQDLRNAIDAADQSEHPDKVYIAEKKSDSYLDGLIKSAMAKIDAKNKNHLIHDLLPYYNANHPLSPEEASKQLKYLCKSFIDNPRDMSIKAPAGLGKTINVISVLNINWYLNAEGKSIKTEIYVPSHRLASEIKQSFRYVPFNTKKFPWQKGVPSPLNVVVIHGRSHLDENGEAYCKKHEVAEELSRKGLPVFNRLCRNLQKSAEKCEHYYNCKHIKQFHEEYDVRIYTTAHLALERSFIDDAIPDYAVIDESFYSYLLQNKSIPISAIINSGWDKNFIDAIKSALLNDLPLLKHLRDALGDFEVYDAIKDAQASLENATNINLFGLDVEEQKQKLKQLDSPSYLSEFLNVLRTELETGRDFSHGIKYVLRTSKIHLHYRKKITRFKDGNNGKKCHVLAIDADLNQSIHNQFYPTAEHYKIEVERNCHVIQVDSTTCSKGYILNSGDASEKRQFEIQSLIKRVSNNNKKVLVVGPQELTGNPAKGHEAKLVTSDPSDLGHFGNIRGMDGWKDYDAVIIVGRNEPRANVAEDVARALFYDSLEPLNFTDELVPEARGYRVRSGLNVGVNVRVHPDPRVQQVIEQIRESESQQAIDRLRFVHGKEGREVYILSNVPLDITVDSLISWKDLMAGGTKLEQAWWESDGVLPLSPDWLAEKFPDLFKSEVAAKESLKDLNQMGGILNNISVKKIPHLIRYKFKLKKQSGKDRACLSQYPETETREKLEILFDSEVVSISEMK